MPPEADGEWDGTERSALIALPKRICFGLLFAGLLAFPKGSFPFQANSREPKASAGFARAVRLRTSLESLPENLRARSDYLKVIEAFQEVARLDPAYAKTPMSLACVAELYEEMGKLFSTETYYLKAIGTYKSLASGYPDSQFARDALLAIAEIYSTDLAKPDEARRSFQQFIEKFPKSPRRAEAQAKIKELDQSPGEAAEEQVAPPGTGPTAATPTDLSR